ncbi:Pectinesterase inhibitor 18 Pectin methylesterase [Vigna angularis]|uniref:Pectinesterase inhibitor 18 Pectin methylesterase n=1 Tax=Phaseolus angularis TaxID=3914 RepID=A0A8T0JFN7_PHAAN|nr:Pectinesterase inhibitor 18 Pectin methylesterase [Vigna angularis]
MSERNADKGKRIIIGVSTLFLVAVVGAIVFGINLNESGSNGNGDNVNNKKEHVTASVKAVQTLCNPTNYKEECEENLMAGVGDNTTTDPYELIKLAFNITIEKITDKFEEMNILHDIEKEPRAKMALETCRQLMDLSVSELERSFIGMSEFNLMSVDKILMNLKVWLTGALTYQDTCLDEFENTTSDADKSKRVNWNGILNLNSKAARLFSPSKFFHGLDWVRATGVPCFHGVPPHYKHKNTTLTW